MQNVYMTSKSEYHDPMDTEEAERIDFPQTMHERLQALYGAGFTSRSPLEAYANIEHVPSSSAPASSSGQSGQTLDKTQVFRPSRLSQTKEEPLADDVTNVRNEWVRAAGLDTTVSSTTSSEDVHYTGNDVVMKDEVKDEEKGDEM